ncbi:ATP-binding protein [Streptomyces sp. SHP 1-2]|uniref:ATP-binding protein n=1 Tax=Streptomyces sp. SHP 1-2 TaxID=2769489 RepID=UPI00223885E6|nr:helix-turn-helix transcriptional regulator [Streptomyces sp. SHP 1-2]MCW5251932.1 AAA family ATPase [Streptomyces sp. SHP 1-2]
MLVGRSTERKAIERLLAAARTGRSGVLVVCGEAGIGKTSLLEHAGDVASGFRVERAPGVESEMEFAFSGLHQVCAPLLDRLGALPPPQRTALGVAFGLCEGEPPDRFLVALATLGLLAEAAEERPLLCLMDDAQWLDTESAQTLAFVARRVRAERLGLLFALRDPAPAPGRDSGSGSGSRSRSGSGSRSRSGSGSGDACPFAGLPKLRLAGLGAADARQVLATAVRTPMDQRVRDQVIAEARGNPLVLAELPLSAGPEKLAGGFGLPHELSVPRRIEESFRRRSRDLPAGTRLLLLVAAAEPLGDTALLWDAAAHLGIDADAAAGAQTAGLLEVGTRVRFPHPLVRSAVYRAAEPSDRRRAHYALAMATDPRTEPDRRVWHRAQATLGADETIAAELERSAGRARARGGPAAAAAFLERAVMLTPGPGDRARRALSAAHAKHTAGAPSAALELLTVAEAGPLPALGRARAKLLGAQIAFHALRNHDVPGMLLDAAKEFAPLDASLARDICLQALESSHLRGTSPHGVLEVAAVARAASPPSTPPHVVDLFLDGLVVRATSGHEACVPLLQRALTSLDDRDHEPHRGERDGGDSRWLLLASRVATALWDDEALHTIATRHVRLARESGALAALPSALHCLAAVVLLTGELTRAAELGTEAAAYTRVTDASPLPSNDILLAAWRGRQTAVEEMHAAVVDATDGQGEGTAAGLAHYSLAVLHNGLGNYTAALAAAMPPYEFDELVHSNLALPELIEAAVRCGRPELAAGALHTLSSRARASGTEWALGLAARSRALTSSGPAAEESYLEAIERLGRCRMALDLARAHLVHGEWLRRERRPQEAREHLRTAHRMLSDRGAAGFAARAARELRATGGQPHQRTAGPADALTAHELHIARLVATGATSKEVAVRLFLSPRTIDAHLRTIFRKLDITSRRQLRGLLLT